MSEKGDIIYKTVADVGFYDADVASRAGGCPIELTVHQTGAVDDCGIVLPLHEMRPADAPHAIARLAEEELSAAVVEVERAELIRARRVVEEAPLVGVGVGDGRLRVGDGDTADPVSDGVYVRRAAQDGPVLCDHEHALLEISTRPRLRRENVKALRRKPLTDTASSIGGDVEAVEADALGGREAGCDAEMFAGELSARSCARQHHDRV